MLIAFLLKAALRATLGRLAAPAARPLPATRRCIVVCIFWCVSVHLLNSTDGAYEGIVSYADDRFS